MAIYTCQCGHIVDIEIFGDAADRNNYISWINNSLCSVCHKILSEEYHATHRRGVPAEEVPMPYRYYKEFYFDCRTKRDSYDESSKSIVVYVSLRRPTVEQMRSITKCVLKTACHIYHSDKYSGVDGAEAAAALCNRIYDVFSGEEDSQIIEYYRDLEFVHKPWGNYKRVYAMLMQYRKYTALI